MSDPFVHLHTHCEYSFLDGYGHPHQFVERAKQLGQKALAITDHGNVSAHKKWHDACTAAGIKPILGVEAYVVNHAAGKDQRHSWHITLLAKTLEGYRNLLKVVSRSWEEGFYYNPRTDWEILKAHSKGLVATSGCPGGRVGYGVVKEGWNAKQTAAELKRQAGLFEDYYVELSPWQYPNGIKVAESVYDAAKAEGLPLVMTMDAHYPAPEDAFKQDVMLCIQNNVQFNDPDRMKFTQQDFCLNSGGEMAQKWEAIHGSRLPMLDEMIFNTRKIAEASGFDFPNATPLEFPYDGNKTEYLHHLCEQGLKAKGLTQKQNYKDRLNYEFDLVVSKNFVDYFLIVADLIVHAKSQGMLVGAARGSSCGSLMCFLLRITEIDPLVHGLLVERFIDVSRTDLPDIDIDFEAERRHEVKEYLSAKYGADKVANLATFVTFKGRLCLQDVGRVFSDRIPPQAVDEVKRLIIQRSSADSRAGFTMEDTFTNFDQAAEWLKKYPELGLAKHLEGQVRQLGVHAAGVVVSNEPISNFAATYVTKNKDRVISMDYADVTSVGLLKIDILGLTALTAVKRTLALIKERHDKEIVLEDLPLDDKAVYKNFCNRNLQGIFQFEGASTRQVCRQVQPDNFNQLVAVNALSRPGPLHSGGTTSYIDRRWGREPVESLHPILDEITKDTYGITVYQEQVMMTVRKMGLFDWKETATIRKAMSKKFGDEFFAKMCDKFVVGATSQGVASETAMKIWKNICTFGSWAFNQSHSVAYSVMAYQLMWLKTHYPSEFYAGVISCEQDAEKQRRMFKEFTVSGRKLAPVCINQSGKTVGCDQEGLRLGLDAVVGLSEKMRDSILKARPFKSYPDFTKRCKIPKAQADKLLKIGAFRNLEFEALTEQQDLFGAHLAKTDEFDYRKPSEKDLREFCPLQAEGKTYIKWREWVAKKATGKLWLIRDLDDITDRTELILIGSTNPGTSFNAKNKQEETASRGNVWQPKEGEEGLTKEQYNFLNFDFEDETDSVIVRISYKLYVDYKSWIWGIKADDVLGVRGMMNGTMRMVFATHVVNLTEIGRKIRAKQPLTKIEQEFFKGREPRKFKRRS